MISPRSRLLIHGVRRPRARAMPTHSATVTGKLQSIDSTCGTRPTVTFGRSTDTPRHRAHRAEHHLQQRRLARTRWSDDADEVARLDREVDVDQHRWATVVVDRDVVDGDQAAGVRVAVTTRHRRPPNAGPVITGGTRRCPGRCRELRRPASAEASPPSASVIVMKLNFISPSHEWSASPGAPGRSSSRRSSTYTAPVSLAICSSTGDGNTSEPNTAVHVLGFDLLDQVDDLSRRRVAEVGRLHRPDHVPAVGVGEVGVGVVVGDQLALLLGDRVERLTDRGVELVDEDLELGEVGVELLGALRRDRAHLLADDVGVHLDQRRVGPQVRVRLAAVLGEREVVLVLVGLDRPVAELDDLDAVADVGRARAPWSAPRAPAR